MQCLSAAAPLAAFLAAAPHARCDKPFCAVCFLRDHFAALSAPDAATAKPPSLAPLVARIKRLGAQFVAGRQEDAHDFVHAVLDACHVSLLDDLGGEARFDSATRATSGVCHLFGGCTRSVVRCRRCGGVSATHEPFLTLPLDVAPRGVSTLEEALAASFGGGEELRGGNAYACERCAALTPARKVARIAAPPNLLVLALKRYTGGFFGKLNKRVAYGATLDLTRFCTRSAAPPAAEPAADGAAEAAPAGAAEHASASSPSSPPPPVYRLYGVVVHLDWALSTAAGHYVSYVRRDGGWWKCDDATVTQCSEATALSQNAYMLFYQAVAARPAPGVRPPGQPDTPEEAAEEAARLAAIAKRAAEAEAADSAEAALGEQLPAFTLTAFGKQDAPENTRAGEREPERSWPAQVRLTVALPRCARSAGISLSAEGQAFELHVPGKYRLSSTLPYPVNEDLNATFNTDKRELSLMLQVLALPRDPPAPPAPPPPPPPPPPPLPKAGTGVRGGLSAALRGPARANGAVKAADADDDDDDDDAASAPGLSTHALTARVAAVKLRK